MFDSPVTTCLLAGIMAFAYYLWEKKIDPSLVATSFSGIFEKKEYWRAITAAFAHFDLMHLGFNAMALSSFASLELIYGSMVYGYLSFELIFITELICVTIAFIRIKFYNNTELSNQTAVGYSCVLFAWMVAASVRMQKFCPIFLVPSLCFSTWHLPVPLTELSLPVNIGPILLLFLTKLIIPRSSFTGHLSGIIIGYPLAWNMLNGFTPPLFFSLLIVLLLFHNQSLLFWKIPGYVNLGDFRDFAATPAQQHHYRLFLGVSLVEVISTAFIAVFVIEFSVLELCLRIGVTTFVVIAAIQARRCLWIVEQRSTQEDCVGIMCLSLSFIALLLVMDISTLAAASSVSLQSLLLGNAMSSSRYFLILCGGGWGVVVHGLYCISLLLNLHDFRVSESLLQWVALDTEAVSKDMSRLTLGWWGRGGGGGGGGSVFSGASSSSSSFSASTTFHVGIESAKCRW